MGRNKNLNKAKKEKNDEFYTLYKDVKDEISAYVNHNPDVFRGKTILLPCDNPEWSSFTRYFHIFFDKLGLKKLISTFYNEGKPSFKCEYDGKEVVETPLQGDGDFRSKEITTLRDEADFIITNPPFSLFREFLDWIVEADKKFVIIGNMNAISYKNVFPLIAEDNMWIGKGGNISLTFKIPDDYYVTDEKMIINGQKYATMPSICWFTNVEHGKRYEPMILMTMADNIKFNKKLKGLPYQEYDNYDAIEVPFTDSIPSDYSGVMGVPISFLDKYCPEQFKIIGNMASTIVDEYNKGYPFVNGKRKYARILIKHKKEEK